MPEPEDITSKLHRANAGDVQAAAELFALVKKDLRGIVHRRKRLLGVHPGVDASTTGLIDDAFMRLVRKGQATDRRMFFAFAARKVHDMLIDLLRKHRVRTGSAPHGDLDEDIADAPRQLSFLVDLKEALARISPDDALVYLLRTLFGSTFKEAAEIAGMPKTTASRGFRDTVAYLRSTLKDYGGEDLT